MSPIWIDFALAMGCVLLTALIGIPLVLCHLDKQDGPRVRHVDVTPAPRPLSPLAKDLRERLLQQRRSREQEIIAEQVKQAARARGIDTRALGMIDDLYEMVHGKKHHEG